MHGAQSANFDAVFIDLNCVIHPSLRSSKSEAAFIKKLFKTLDKLLEQFMPSRVCYLSVDGPAPVAKMLLQKARRQSKYYCH
ncbi:hypothetical protein BGZ94_008753 [Podila epigama]|nr:hypothetical protein BGZ94_008753 [Podila epigama]